MESIGVYWKAVYAVLERHFDLFVGKQVGVFGAVLLAARLGLARLPEGVTRTQLYGGAVLCGIGFTMSLFIGDLAFRQTPQGDEVKLAVFVGVRGAGAVDPAFRGVGEGCGGGSCCGVGPNAYPILIAMLNNRL